MERKMSNKINYDVLKTLSSISNDLFGHGVGGASSTSGSGSGLTPKTEDEDSKPIVTVIESGPVVPKRNMKRNQTSESDEPASSSSKKSRSSKRTKSETSAVLVKPEPVEKESKVKPEENGSSSGKPSDGNKNPDEFVIESGPVRYADDHEHDSEEEEEQFSASQLLTKFRGVEDDDDDDYY
jgi:hypothetical protein